MKMSKLILLVLFLLSLSGCTPNVKTQYVTLSPPNELTLECQLSEGELSSGTVTNLSVWDELNLLLDDYKICNAGKMELVNWLKEMEKLHGNK